MRTPTKAEIAYWGRLCEEVGCCACRCDGHYNPHVSVHHIRGRTQKGCHMDVLPLCAGHHQDNGTLTAVHPWKAAFESKYGPQMELKARCDKFLEDGRWD